MELHPTQKEVAKDNSIYRVVCCGRQWGKTTLAVLEMIAYAYAKKDTDVAYFATTFDQARNIAWNMLKEFSEPAWAKPPNESRLELFLKSQDGGTSRISLRGWESVETARGQQFDFLVLDEVAQMRNFDYNWEAALAPTLRFKKGKCLFLSTPYGYNHFFELFKNGQEDSKHWKSWKFTTYDNPHFPPEEIEIAKEDSTTEYFSQEYLATFTSHTGLVYKFDRLHHIKELTDFKPVFYIRGLDRGFRNPTAVPIIAVNQDDVWYQEDEIYQAGLTNPQVAAIIKQKSGTKLFELSTMDSADASDIKDLSDLGADFIPVKKESGESNLSYVRWKIEKFSERLKIKPNGKAGYYVHPRCVNTVEEFEKYSYPESKQEVQEKEAPMKLNDHMMDALGDLNAMYMHYYEPKKKFPGEGKIKGTYIPSYEEEKERGNEWTKPIDDKFW